MVAKFGEPVPNKDYWLDDDGYVIIPALRRAINEINPSLSVSNELSATIRANAGNLASPRRVAAIMQLTGMELHVAINLAHRLEWR